MGKLMPVAAKHRPFVAQSAICSGPLPRTRASCRSAARCCATPPEPRRASASADRESRRRAGTPGRDERCARWATGAPDVASEKCRRAFEHALAQVVERERRRCRPPSRRATSGTGTGPCLRPACCVVVLEPNAPDQRFGAPGVLDEIVEVDLHRLGARALSCNRTSPPWTKPSPNPSRCGVASALVAASRVQGAWRVPKKAGAGPGSPGSSPKYATRCLTTTLEVYGRFDENHGDLQQHSG